MSDILTLLVPVKDRPQYLRRLMSYLEQEQCEFQILIADGSSDSSSNTVVREFTEKSNLKIQYFQYATDTDLNVLVDKLVSVGRKISSEFVVWACDDDFYNLDSLRRGVTFLQSHPDYAAYAGEVLDFNVLPKFGRRDRCRGTAWIQEQNRFCSQRYSHKTSVQFGDVTQRVAAIDCIFPTEAIHRAKVIQQSFEILDSIPIKSIMSINFVLGIVSLAYGKFFVDENLLLLRQDNTPGSAGSLTASERSSLTDIAEQLVLLNTVSQALQIDVTTLRATLEFKVSSGSNACSSDTIFAVDLQPSCLRIRLALRAFILYLRVARAKISKIGESRDLRLPLVDTQLLTKESTQLFLKVQNALS